MTVPVYFNGVGLVTSLGGTLAASAKKYAAMGKALIRDATVIGPDGLPQICAPVLRVMQERDLLKRLQYLVNAALTDLAEQTGPGARPVHVSVCLPGWLKALQDQPALEAWPGLGRLGPVTQMNAVYCDGESVFEEIAKARNAVAQAPETDAIVVAVDTYLHAFLLDQLAASKRLLCASQPHGIVPSEAGVAIRLTAESHVDFNLPTGWIEGHWSASETQDVQRPETMLGDALAGVLCPGASSAPADRLMIDVNGERWRSEELGVALARSADLPADLMADFETPLVHTGFSGIAAGAVMLAFAMVPGSVPATAARERSLMTTSAIWGKRDALVVVRDTGSGAILREDAT